MPGCCVSVCAIMANHLPVDWRPLVNEHIANIGIPLYLIDEILDFEFFDDFWALNFFGVCGSLPTSLVCIMRELAGEGLWLWQVKGVRKQATPDTWLFVCVFFFPFWAVSVYVDISATIHTGKEIQCLPSPVLNVSVIDKI